MMDPNEARAVLLAKVKEDKAKMETLEKVLQVEDDEIQELRKSLSELKNDLDDRTNGKSGGNDPAQQYDKLAQLDQEMTAFLDSFPTKKDEELHAQRQAQLMVVKLLEHISSTIAKEDKILPSANAAHLEEMRRDLTFKERQLESSVSTKQRLTMELQKRQAELDKVNTLDTKISLELGSLLQKMDTMTTDMAEFAKIDELKETHMQTKQFLQRAKQQYIRRRDAMKQQVNALQMQLENLKQETANHDTAKSLEALEQKLRHHEQNIFHLKEYIDTKSREINYEHVKQDCLKTLTELNALRVKQQGVLNNL
jgi:intraflagellar transport protein 74